jgi:hypothetical protein
MWKVGRLSTASSYSSCRVPRGTSIHIVTCTEHTLIFPWHRLNLLFVAHHAAKWVYGLGESLSVLFQRGPPPPVIGRWDWHVWQFLAALVPPGSKLPQPLLQRSTRCHTTLSGCRFPSGCLPDSGGGACGLGPQRHEAPRGAKEQAGVGGACSGSGFLVAPRSKRLVGV